VRSRNKVQFSPQRIFRRKLSAFCTCGTTVLQTFLHLKYKQKGLRIESIYYSILFRVCALPYTQLSSFTKLCSN